MASDRLLLVGSIPLDGPEAVFGAVGNTLGQVLERVPDGETGERANWIGWQHRVFAEQDALERIDAPEREYQLGAPFRLKPGRSVAEIAIGALGFASEALASYETFRRFRDDGQFRHDCRFQICLPTPFAPVFSFVAYESQGKIYSLYEARVLAELAEICAAIPHGDLAVQWDVATEMSIFEKLHPVPFLGADPAPWLIDRLARLGVAVPTGVELGYHLCYGSMNNRHWKEPEDLEICVDTINRIAARTDRRIDWVHMPVPIDRDDADYFAPLRHLVRDPVIPLYLGLIHDRDGVEGADRRIAAAETAASGFGIATECGLGRCAPEEVSGILALHGRLASR